MKPLLLILQSYLMCKNRSGTLHSNQSDGTINPIWSCFDWCQQSKVLASSVTLLTQLIYRIIPLAFVLVQETDHGVIRVDLAL